jgi:hypothetical protein
MTIKETLLTAIAAQVDRRKESQRLAGEDRHQAHLGIRAQRFDLRHLYLAYAFERGIDYSRLEKTCLHKPSVDVIVSIANNIGTSTCIHMHVQRWLDRDIKPENSTEVPDVEAPLAHAG